MRRKDQQCVGPGATAKTGTCVKTGRDQEGGDQEQGHTTGRFGYSGKS